MCVRVQEEERERNSSALNVSGARSLNYDADCAPIADNDIGLARKFAGQKASRRAGPLRDDCARRFRNPRRKRSARDRRGNPPAAVSKDGSSGAASLPKSVGFYGGVSAPRAVPEEPRAKLRSCRGIFANARAHFRVRVSGDSLLKSIVIYGTARSHKQP